MKYIKILLMMIAFLVVIPGKITSVYSQQTELKTVHDTIKRNAAIADSLQLVSKIKLVLHKKKAHASYYADKFNGRRTASGRKFDNNKYTAAHRKLPFGTKVKITNEANGKSVLVEVIDRGPFIKGREIDLSKRAFMDIAGSKYGGALIVTIEIVK